MGYDNKKDMRFYLRHISPACGSATTEKKEESKEVEKKKCCLPQPGEIFATAIFKKGKLGLGMEVSHNFQEPKEPKEPS